MRPVAPPLCWKIRREYIEETFGEDSQEMWEYWGDEDSAGICLLPEGHAEPHDFTPNSRIAIAFLPWWKRALNQLASTVEAFRDFLHG